MTRLSATEAMRLRSLISEHALEPIEDVLLAEAAPCITLRLSDAAAGTRDAGIDDPPLGVSRMGGLPDVPANFEWPVFRCSHSGEDVYAGFLMQIDLATLPRLDQSPLPAQGLLSIFHRDQCAEFEESYVACWFGGDAGPLRRVSPPPLQCASGYAPCLDGKAFLIEGRIGIDVPDKGQHDVLANLLYERFEAESGDLEEDSAGHRLSQLQSRALHADHEARLQDGLPFDWWHVGQLLGRIDQGNAAWVAMAARGDAGRRYDLDYLEHEGAALQREAAANWRLLLQLETNTLTGFSGDADTAPVLLLAGDDGSRPWPEPARIFATMAP